MNIVTRACRSLVDDSLKRSGEESKQAESENGMFVPAIFLALNSTDLRVQ